MTTRIRLNDKEMTSPLGRFFVSALILTVLFVGLGVVISILTLVFYFWKVSLVLLLLVIAGDVLLKAGNRRGFFHRQCLRDGGHEYTVNLIPEAFRRAER